MEKNRVLKKLLGLFLLILAFIFCDYIVKLKNSEEKIHNKISSSLQAIQNQHDSINSDLKNNPQTFLNSGSKTSPAIYIFKNDSLVYWSSDINDPNTLFNNCIAEKNIFTQGNYNFFVTRVNLDSLSFLTSTPLYYKNPDNSKNNIYLPKKINGFYSINFTINENGIDHTIQYQAKMNNLDSYLIGTLAIIILIKFFNSIYKFLRYYRPNKNNYLPFLIISSIVYGIFILLQKKLFLNTSDLFGTSCLLPNCKYSFSLGNLAEFSILLFGNITILSGCMRKEISLKQNLRTLTSSFIFISILLIYTYFTYELISSINIPFSFLQIYDTSVNSYIFLVIIATLTCSVIILLQILMKIFVTEKQSYLWSIIIFLIIGITLEIIANQFIELHFSLITNIIGILFYLIIVWGEKSKSKTKDIVRSICIITLMTSQLTYILYLTNETKEHKEMSWFATVIGDESDESFEKEISNISEKIKKDVNIINWQKDNEFPSDDSILNYFNKKYFDIKEIKDYNRVVTLCDTSTILVLKDLDDYELNCNALFNEILKLNRTKKINEELTLIDDPTTDSYYILTLDLSSIDSNYTNICYVEFYKEYILNYIGIPELITSHENILLPNLVNYSFSCYEDNILQYKYGFYNYPNELNNFKYKDKEYVTTRHLKHLTKTFDDHKTIIVTIEKSRFIDIIAPFSYIFIVLSLMYYLSIRFYRRQETVNIRQSLHTKMQLTVILTLGFSFIVAGITSFIFMRNSLQEKAFEFQYEKNKSVVKNLENDLYNDIINDYEHLKKYKENYFTDVNIYDLNGNLTNSTQPRLFNGFKSKIINREAFESIIIKNRFYYSNEEEIDGTKYNSSYFPLKDKDGNIHAIINIPYFDNKIKNKSSMSNFVITYLNIILVLMGVSAFIVILMTRKTIKPLEIIQNKMQKISLGGKNEEIEWNSNDEIGDLITIYNRLIKELEISANNLMRSERETAWREMARQVAHEIKNPLTPMKLNIQFLQMAWNEKNPDIDKKLRDTTNSLLEQIDILSNIATAFSNYAKLPKKNIEAFNIKELINNTINLYNNSPNIKIEFEEENESDYIINSDKNNLGIVFGNIIKNAIQAIGKKEDGKILIKIKDAKDSYRIEMSDNGCGIDDEAKKKIFMPNFTTKSSGMGVGLSIVYDILETLNGRISFESQVGEGTTFIVEIKK